VAASEIVTDAPGTTAPFGSVTVPRIPVSRVWPSEMAATNTIPIAILDTDRKTCEYDSLLFVNFENTPHLL